MWNIHEASSISTSTSIAQERIFFAAHWGADEALIRSRNSKLFNGEKDANNLSLVTGQKKTRPVRDYTVKVFNIRMLNMHFRFIVWRALILEPILQNPTVSCILAHAFSLYPSIGEHQTPFSVLHHNRRKPCLRRNLRTPYSLTSGQPIWCRVSWPSMPGIYV